MSSSTKTDRNPKWNSRAVMTVAPQLADVYASSCSVQNHIHRDAKSQSYQCYRVDFTFPSCSLWGIAKGGDCLNSKLQAARCSTYLSRNRYITVNFHNPGNILVITSAKWWAHIYSYRSSPTLASLKNSPLVYVMFVCWVLSRCFWREMLLAYVVLHNPS